MAIGKKTIWVVGVLLLTAAGIRAQQAVEPKSFTINGLVKQFKAGDKVFLLASAKPPIKIDSTVLKSDGSFTFTAVEKDGGNFYLVDIPGFQRTSILVAGGEVFTLNAEERGKEAKVTGSKNMEFFNRLNEMSRVMLGLSSKMSEDFQLAEEKKDSKKMQAIRNNFELAEKKHLQSIKEMLPDMGTEIVAVFAANNLLNPENDQEDIVRIAKKFEKENPSPKIVQLFIKNVNIFLRSNEGMVLGEAAPTFTLKNPDDEPISLNALKGKYVLLDFWASWCGPCRQENPNVVRVFKKYKDKGFTVMGVSLDRGKREWVNAIKKDGLDWSHGWDVNSEVSNLYGIRAIPTTYLLDKEGHIIARDLKAEQLDAKLAELLK